MLTKALEAITNVGEIEFHIDEESDEDDEDDEEEEILYDEEEMAREEIEKEEIEGEEVAKEDIYEEPHEEKSVREEKNVTEGGDVTDVQPEKVQPVEEGRSLSNSISFKTRFYKLFATKFCKVKSLNLYTFVRVTKCEFTRRAEKRKTRNTKRRESGQNTNEQTKIDSR